MATRKRLDPRVENKFPRLKTELYDVTSQRTWDYNCIAFAAGVVDAWWWPMGKGPDGKDAAWPEGAPREVNLAAFVAAYRGLCYEICADWKHEDGYQKIAIYAMNGAPTHAAIEQPDGKWKSKLGPVEDIEHENPMSLETVAGVGAYGIAVTFMRREASAPQPASSGNPPSKTGAAKPTSSANPASKASAAKPTSPKDKPPLSA
jgi:hypothetical protein